MFSAIFEKRDKGSAKNNGEIPSTPIRDPHPLTDDYLAQQQQFIQSIGRHMRIGIEEAIRNGKADHEFAETWDGELASISPTERAKLIIDWMNWHILRAHEAASDTIIFQKHPDALPISNLTLRMPDCLNSGSVLKKPVEFTDLQAKRLIGLACMASDQKGSHLHLRPNKRFAGAVEKAILFPDAVLASTVRNAGYKVRWAQQFLKKLCPLEVANVASNDRLNVKRSTKEEQNLDDALNGLTSVLRRLPGMWVTVPCSDNPYWPSLNHQIFPYFDEVSNYLSAVEKAANTGVASKGDKECVYALSEVAQLNLHALKQGRGTARSMSEIAKAFPLREKMRTRSIYWSIGVPEAEKEVIDDLSQPKLKLILSIETKFLSSIEEQIKRIKVIAPKIGLASKLKDMLPGENASKPTKAWLKKASQRLDDQDLVEIVEKLCLADSIIPQNDEFDPRVPFEVYEAKAIAFRETHAMVWAAYLAGEKAMEPLLAFAQKCYQKVPGVGPRSAKLGNAAAISLSMIEGGAGVAALTRLHRDVKYERVKNHIEACIEQAAGRSGVSKQEAEEQAVVDHGFA